ncbi:hypothetical protein BDW68DRAFT_180918 [Aspergillus falconensis]
MDESNHPYPVFYYSHECHDALRLLQDLLELNHEEIFMGAHGDTLREASVDFMFRYKELGIKEGKEESSFDVQLAESPAREVLLYHLKGLHQTLERSIDICMSDAKTVGNHPAGAVLVGCLGVAADQISRFCRVVDEILEVLGLEDKLPLQRLRGG